jgi:hypothetical protein
MAEATLNDVSNAIKEDGSKDREQFKGDSLRQFFQARASNKFLKSLTRVQLDSNEQMKKQFEKEQEALKRANDQTTLNLNNTIKEDGHKTRKQFHVDFARQFFQVGNTNTLLTNLIQSQVAANDGLINLTQAEVDSNKQMKKRFEQEQEALRRANAKKTLAEPANDNETRFQRIISSLIAGVESTINVLERIKKALPNKKTAFGLLFGGLAAAFAFFPEWSKRNLIDPLIDVINVFQGKDYTTTLGRVVQNLKEGLGWISDNFGEEAAWVTGILGTVAALHPITTLKVLSGSLKGFGALGSFLGLPVIGAIGGLVIAAGALLLAKEGLDYLRNLNIEDEVKNIQEKKSALISALASGNVDDIKTAETELRQTLTRMRESTLGDSDRIKAEMETASKVLAEEALKRQKDALNRINEIGELAARDAETKELVRKIKMGAVTSIVGADDPLVEAKAQFEKIAGLNIPQKQKDDLIQIIQGGLDQDQTLKRAQILDINKLFIDMETVKLRQLEDEETARVERLAAKDMFGEMTGESSGLIYRSPEELLNIKTNRAILAEIMGKGGTSRNQNQAEKLAANAEDNDRARNQANPIVPVVASDSRDMSVTNYNITNIFGGRTDPLEGLYGGPNPSSQ